MSDLFDFVRDSFSREGDAVLAIHAHNHHGNAVINVLTAIDHGVRQVEGTIGGIGPSGGNTDLLEVLTRLPIGHQRPSINPETLRSLL